MNDLTIPRAALPVPLEKFTPHTMPEHLTGEYGLNRAHGVRSQLTGNTDVDAIRVWLKEYENSPATLRAYCREVERFYNWIILVRGIAFSSLTREDMMLYDDFMKNPTPHAIWCSNLGGYRRTSDKWRPFVGPVDDKGRSYAMIVIKNLFSYLVDVHYLSGNPLAARRAKNKGTSNQEKKDVAFKKAISLSAIRSLFETLDFEANCRPDEAIAARAAVERMLFVTRFLVNTGLRREELGTVRMCDIFVERIGDTEQTRWFMKVLGKGNKSRVIALVLPARDALQRYRTFYGLPMQYAGNNCHLMLPVYGLPKKGETKPMSGETVHATVRKALDLVAEKLGKTSLDGSELTVATPHWFRHTFATNCLNKGIDLKNVQQQLGHASIETTAIYQHTDLHTMYDSVQNVGI